MKNVKIIVSGRTGGAQIITDVSNDTNVVQFLKDNNSYGSSIAIGGTAVNSNHTFGDFEGDVIKIGVSGNVKPVGHTDEDEEENTNDDEEGGEIPSSFLQKFSKHELEYLYSIENIARFLSANEMKRLLITYLDFIDEDNVDLKLFLSNIRHEKTFRLPSVTASLKFQREYDIGSIEICGGNRVIKNLFQEYQFKDVSAYVNGEKVGNNYIIQEGDVIFLSGKGVEYNDDDHPF